MKDLEKARVRHNMTERKRVNQLKDLYVQLGNALSINSTFRNKDDILHCFGNRFIDDYAIKVKGVKRSAKQYESRESKRQKGAHDARRDAKNCKERSRIHARNITLAILRDFLMSQSFDVPFTCKDILQGCLWYTKGFDSTSGRVEPHKVQNEEEKKGSDECKEACEKRKETCQESLLLVDMEDDDTALDYLFCEPDNDILDEVGKYF